MELDLFGDRRLLLPGTNMGWLWSLLAVVVLVLLIVLYREERRLISRRAGLSLLGLRLASASLLIFALFEPTSAHSSREGFLGRVIVGVDISESMETLDPVEASSPSSHEPGGAAGTRSRKDVARLLLNGKDSPIAQIARNRPLEGFLFAQTAERASLEEIARRLGQPHKPGGGTDARTSSTDWRPVLSEALRSTEAPVVGVVLLTDGLQNAPGDAQGLAERLARAEIPVYPILIGSSSPPRDAAIASIQAPDTVHQGDHASIEAHLKLDGYAGREVTVVLERPGSPPMEQRLKAPDAPGVRPVVRFSVPLSEPGTIPLSLALRPLEGDSRPDNDRRSFSIQVSDEKASVLLVDSDARWELRYLRNALARDQQVELETVVFHQPEATGVSTRPTYGTTLPAWPALDQKGETKGAVDPLGAFDVIVLGDVEPADFPLEAWNRIEWFVAERGGTLVLSTGPRFWPTLTGNEVARGLLPIVNPRSVVPEGEAEASSLPPPRSLPPGSLILPVRAALLDPEAWPMLQLASDPEQSEHTWTQLPRLPWTLAGKPKPGATPLLCLGSNIDSAVAAAQPFGLGKVLWIGGDTWRWRFRVGDTYHHRFWGQVVRWGTSARLAAGNALVRFGPDRPRIAEGETARIQARFSREAPATGPDLLVAARIEKENDSPGGSPEKPGNTVAVLPLRPALDQPRTFESQLPPLPRGRYRVRLEVPQLASALRLEQDGVRVEARFEVVGRETSERVELAVRPELAAQLARTTGGRTLTPAEAHLLPHWLHSRLFVTTRVRETRLWDHPAMLLLFFGLITLEWMMRKYAGLP